MLKVKLKLSCQGHVQPEENLDLRMNIQILQYVASQRKSNFKFVVLNFSQGSS